MELYTKNKLVFLIIDGNAIMHRAYHALPPLTTADGMPTGAVYGFFSMLLKLIQDLHPSCIAVAFDRPKPTFRQTLYVGYQAHRPKMADDLGEQITIVHKMLEEIGIPIFEVDGFEADDIIGTIAFRLQSLKDQRSKIKDQKELETIIVSGDRDLLQLVNSQVKVLAPIIGITKMILYDGALVEEKFGIHPSQMIDYKALVGDASDNYPGVAGVGPKTAAALIKKYGSLDGIYSDIRKIEKENNALAIKLAESQDQAQLAKKLATIVTDVPFQFRMNDCTFSHLNGAKMKLSFQNYGFNSLLKRLNTIFPAKNPQMDLLN